jgi:pilus assembly protein CpaE
MQALRSARHLLVVMVPDLASLRDADRLRQLGTSLGVSNSTIVLNRMGMPGGLKMPLIEQGLGGKPGIQIPDFGKQLGRAANLGKPALGECAIFKNAVAVLAKEVSGGATSRRPQAGSRSLLGRILSR